jgi:hypothetical protein
MIDLVGKKFGKLYITSFFEKENRSYIWNCICDCGNLLTRSTGQLNRGQKLGRVQSCRKCAQRANKSKDLGESSWKMLYNNYISGAKRRKLYFELTFEEFKLICSQNCHYCDDKPSKHNRYIRSDGTLGQKISQFTADRSWIEWNGIDRKYNFKGYEKDNIVPCCSSCNLMKGTQDYHEFIAKCANVYLNRKIQNDRSKST